MAATLARFADEMVGLSVVLFVLERTGSPALAGAAVAGYTLPAVLTGPLLGAWLANAGKRATLALAGNELVLACVAVALVVTVGHVAPVVVGLLTALAGVSLPLTSAGYSSLLPAMVGRAALARANTVDAVSVNGPSIAGPAVAGTLAAAFSPATAMVGIAVAAVLAAVVTLPMRVAPRAADAIRPSLLRLARSGLAHLARTPPLRGATLTSVGSLGCLGLLTVALPARVVQLGARSADAGYLWTAFEVGGLLGVVLISTRLRGERPERAVFASVTGYGVLLGVLAFLPNLTATLVVAVAAGIAEGPCLPSVFAARQRYSPDSLLAQVSTTGASLKIGAFALGSVLSGTLTGTIGPAGMLLLAAAGQLAAVAGGLAIGRTPVTSESLGRTP
ncbi:MAG TPA: MFS transporter [Pseudonocardiaceae bacterium]|nr:MFS transporter [Pseudonocardiaceae bacterium]